MKKFDFLKIVCVMLSLTLAIFMVGCGGQEAESAPETSGASDEAVSEVEPLALTLDELSAYNGKDGQPAYIAIDGVIYDVTGLAQWSGGEHNGFEAGNDLTEEIKEISPHGVAKLKAVPVVGEVVE